MSNDTTIAVIGVTGKKELSIATLFAGVYHVLLFDQDQDELVKACEHILHANKLANVEMIPCATNASWEADVIFLSGYCHPDPFISKKIAQVATQKIVVIFTTTSNSDLSVAPEFTWQQLLPHSKLITVFSEDVSTSNEQSKQLILRGNDLELLKKGVALFTSVGFSVEILITPFI